MEKTHTEYPSYTDITCTTCDGLGFVFKGELWKPQPCECMDDAPDTVKPFEKD